MKKTFIYKIAPILIIYDKNITAFEPDHILHLIWDFSHIFFILLRLFFIPMKISFNFELNNIILNIFLDKFPFYFYIIDILISLNTAYYQKGLLIYDKFKIFKNYMKNDLLIDFISIFTPMLLSFIFHNDLCLALFLFRIIKLSYLVKKIELLLQTSEKNHNLFELTKLIFLVLFIAHICGCVWNLTSELLISKGYNGVWLQMHNLVDQPWIVKYFKNFK